MSSDLRSRPVAGPCDSIFSAALTDDEISKFWLRVNRVDGACWGWTGARTPQGYGFFTRYRKVKGIWRKATEYAHRASYKIHIGPIPEGMNVCHHCDNPPCSNPDHLFAGTTQDNVDDMILKGRHPNIPRAIVLRQEP